MRLFSAVRQRAKWIEAEAAALVRKHGRDAYTVACDMEQQANTLSAILSWHAIKKVILSRPPADGIDLLPPVRASNCISCLVQKISATHEGGPPNLYACIACVAQRIGGGSLKLNLKPDVPSKRAVCPAHDQVLEHQ